MRWFKASFIISWAVVDTERATLLNNEMWVWPIPAWHLPLGAGRGDIALGWGMRHVEKELAENNFFKFFVFFSLFKYTIKVLKGYSLAWE